MSTATCPDCATELGPALLACPVCARLVHGERIRSGVAEAEAAEGRGDLPAALVAWRGARELLPEGSKQHVWITAKVQTLSRAAESSPGAAVASPGPSARRGGWAGIWGVLGVLVFKLKAVLVLLLANAKLLLAGGLKGVSLVPALMSLGVLGASFGWRVGAGLMASLYVHELGHVAWSRRLGMPVTAPMFVPGLGAFVRLRHRPVDAREDALIGLAGPLWGLGAAVALLLAGAIGHWSWARDAAWWAAVLNLVNLIPLGPLDGGRAFRALSRGQRGWVASAATVAFLAGGGWAPALVGVTAALRAGDPTAPAAGDRAVMGRFLAVLVALAIAAGATAKARAT